MLNNYRSKITKIELKYDNDKWKVFSKDRHIGRLVHSKTNPKEFNFISETEKTLSVEQLESIANKISNM